MLSYEELKEYFKGTDAYLCGGGARSIMGLAPMPPNDWDVLLNNPADIIPDIPGARGETCFGGVRFIDAEVDVWHDNVGHSLHTCRWHEKAVAIHLATGCVMGTEEFFDGYTGEVTTREIRVPPPRGYPGRGTQE